MSPVATCGRCGRPRVRGACHCGAGRQQRRAYSGTAAERAMRIAVLEHYGARCFYADTDPLCPGTDVDPNAFELAHVQAHADGGPFVLENLRAAHPLCNRRAGR